MNKTHPTLVWCILGAHEVMIQAALQRVQGWEKPRKGGGANQIVLRETKDEFACWECIEKRKHNIAQGQDALW